MVDIVSSENGASYVEICNLDKNCRAWTKRIIDVIEKKYNDVCPKDNYITLTQDLLTLRSLVTTSPIVLQEQDAVTIENNIVKYNSDRKAEVVVLVDFIRHSLYKMKNCVSEK